MFTKQDIYNYIDKNGIPYGTLIRFEIKIQKNERDILQEILLENDPTLDETIKKGELLISKHTHWGFVEPRLPKEFKLTLNEQIDIILNWFKDTTGYFINEFKTLFELPILNGKPFLLSVDRENNESFLILANNSIDGNLSINQKFNQFGTIQTNWINTFGRISYVNGNVYINNQMNDFGDLEIVNGNLCFSNHIYQDNLETLNPIKKVNGDLYLKNTHVSLGSLEEVQGNLNLRKTTVKDLGSLKKVGKNILVSKSEKHRYDFSNIKINGKVMYYNDEFNKGKLTTI